MQSHQALLLEPRLTSEGVLPPFFGGVTLIYQIGHGVKAWLGCQAHNMMSGPPVSVICLRPCRRDSKASKGETLPGVA